jgi:two-component SAPR family response regulator
MTTTTYRTVAFNTDDDMDKAFYELVHNIKGGFTGVNENSIIITKEQCDKLNEKNVNYDVVDEWLG